MNILEQMKVPYFKEGSEIHIKEKNKGKFTQSAKQHGMGVQEFASHVLSNKDNYSPTLVKRANFARNAKAWKHQKGGNLYSAGNTTESLYRGASKVESLGMPEHKYDFTQTEEWANAHGYLPDERGHRDDRVKKESHPTHPSRGSWKGMNQFHLTDKGMQDVNHTLFGMADGGQDPQATLYYKNSIVLPEITVTPKETYIHNTYDNLKIKFQKGGQTPSRNWDNTLTGKLINYSENPDSIGWDAKTRRWYAPPANKGYDTDQFGMGVDRNQTPGFKDKVKKDKQGREYLTAEDERYLRFLAIDRANKSANERYAYAQKATGTKGSVSPKHDAITVSAIYNLGSGRVARTLFEDMDIMKALFDRKSNTYQKAVHRQYKAKDRNERIDRELRFFKKRNM